MISLKQQVVRTYISLRRLSSHFRALPNVLIVGAQRSGTTSLAAYLSQHPDVESSFFKEVHYFDDGVTAARNSYQKGEDWYRAHFPLRKRAATSPVLFEATPMYLFHPLAPERIHKLLPSAKIIAILRNPVDRAISHYRHSTSRGHETLPLLDALMAEENRIGTALRDSHFGNDDVRRFSYKARGLYAEQIERYQAKFPRENILLVSSDDLFRAPDEVLNQIFQFIGVQPDLENSDITPRNVSQEVVEVPQEARDYLHDYFREPNQALNLLLGRDFGW